MSIDRERLENARQAHGKYFRNECGDMSLVEAILAADDRWREEHRVRCGCGAIATHRYKMHTHDHEPQPICPRCIQQGEADAAEVNEFEMRNFGGAYGLVSWTLTPIGDQQ
jgi:hypothetical protein